MKALSSINKKNSEIESTLLDYYVMSMSSLWETVRKDDSVPNSQEMIDKIEKYLENPDADWVQAYRTEQLIVPFMSEAQLDIRYEARLSEARDRLSLFNTSAHKKNWEAAKKDTENSTKIDAKRAAFQAFLDEIQWEYIRRRFNRQYRLDAARRLWVIGLCTLLVVLLPWLALSSGILLGESVSSIPETTSESAKRAPVFEFYTAISFGLLGALFSRLNSFQVQAASLSYVQMTEVFRASFLLVRLGFGMIGSLILYFMLAGKLLEGGLFPNFEKMALIDHPVSLWNIQLATLLPNAEFAKLVVWSFIGGFSERLIPAALEKAEDSAPSTQSPYDEK